MNTHLRTAATTATIGAVLLLSAACGGTTEQATPASTVQTPISASSAPSGGAAPVASADPSRDAGPNSGGGPFDDTTGCPDWSPDPTQPVFAGISNRGVTLYAPSTTSTGKAQTCGAGSTDLPTRIPFGAVDPKDPTQLAWPATQSSKPGVWDVLSVTTNTLTPNVGTGTYTQGSTLVWKDGIPEQGLSLPVAAGSSKDVPVPATRGAVNCRTAEGAAAIVLNAAYDAPDTSAHDPADPRIGLGRDSHRRSVRLGVGAGVTDSADNNLVVDPQGRHINRCLRIRR